jgi:trans-2,3-dihydro-3-hydroxyanthranilate isomerase
VTARYLLVDVFAREPLAGNALAVFNVPDSVEPRLMQRIAREMNLSETTFVTAIRPDGYDVRIFTPTDELPFAGHPTLGTAWVLRHVGAVAGATVTQRSGAGETEVTFEGEYVWLERSGLPGEDTEDIGTILETLGLSRDVVGFPARALGTSSRMQLRPAVADAGLPWLMLPLADPSVVAALRVPSFLHGVGVYCFAPFGPGRVKARFFAPESGVPEDPATGSAAAALGVYLGARAGRVSIEIEQGAEIGRPSFISLEGAPGRARIGGAVHVVAEATLAI